MAEQLGLTGSTLPLFGRTDDAGYDRVWRYDCCRCGKFFLTGEPLEAATAPCPHCFKVSQVPA